MNAHSKMAFAPTQVTEPVSAEKPVVVSAKDVMMLGGGDWMQGKKELQAFLNMERDPTPAVAPVDRPKNVRAATEKDEDALLDLLMEEVRENAARIAIPSEDRVLHQIRLATRPEYGAGEVFGLAPVIDGPDGTLSAGAILHSFQWWWSHQHAVYEVMLYVRKEARQSGYFRDLFNFEKWAINDWSRGFGYQIYLLTGVLGGPRIKTKTAAYKRHFRQAGIACVYPSPFPGDYR